MNVPAGLSTEMTDMVIQTLRQVVGRELPDDEDHGAGREGRVSRPT